MANPKITVEFCIWLQNNYELWSKPGPEDEPVRPGPVVEFKDSLGVVKAIKKANGEVWWA